MTARLEPFAVTVPEVADAVGAVVRAANMQGPVGPSPRRGGLPPGLIGTRLDWTGRR
jgi:hypothetical protein